MKSAKQCLYAVRPWRLHMKDVIEIQFHTDLLDHGVKPILTN
jgi:hypothetical protein